jgi:hypothetical protein
MSADAPVLSFPLPYSPALDRPRPSKRPHEPATVAAVRLLYERSTLTYAEIARRTGVSQASVSRYAMRAAGAGRRVRPRRLPSPMACRQLERDPEPDLEALAWVLTMLETAREEEAMARRHPAPRPIMDPHITYGRSV